MKKLIPFYITAIVPYILILATIAVFTNSFSYISDNNSVTQYLFDSTLIFVFASYFISVVISCITFIVSIIKKWDAKKLLFANMIVKVIQIPAYIAIFAMGVCSLITIFTFPVAIIFWMLDCVSVFSSGLIGMSGAIRGKCEKKFKTGFTVVSSVLSYIFCVDVVMAVIMYIKAKKKIINE